MASKARHIASLMADASRGVDVGNAAAVIKASKQSGKGKRLGASDNDDLLVANTTSDKVGIQTDNPQATLDVEGVVRIGTDLEDNSGRVFKVHYANGDISWGE